MLDLAIQLAQTHYERYKAAYPYAYEMVKKIIEDYGVTIDEFPMLNNHFAGMLWNDDGHYIIVINPDLPKPRRLFTLAHELGHFLMHRFYQPAFFCTRLNGQAFDPKERQANVFAAELLMPLDRIRQFARMGITLKNAARCIGVSEAALQYRIKDLKQRRYQRTVTY